MFKYPQNRKTHHGRLNAQKRFDPANSYEQNSAIVEGAGEDDRLKRKIDKT